MVSAVFHSPRDTAPVALAEARPVLRGARPAAAPVPAPAPVPKDRFDWRGLGAQVLPPVIGMAEGEEKTFTVTFPEDYQQPELAGQLVQLLLGGRAEVGPHDGVGLGEVVGQLVERAVLHLEDPVAVHPRLRHSSTVDRYPSGLDPDVA